MIESDLVVDLSNYKDSKISLKAYKKIQYTGKNLLCGTKMRYKDDNLTPFQRDGLFIKSRSYVSVPQLLPKDSYKRQVAKHLLDRDTKPNPYIGMPNTVSGR